MQSLLAAIYPMLKTDFHLDFWQIGLLTLAFQVTASLLQPLIGMYTDKRPLPYSLPVGMALVAGRPRPARDRAQLPACCCSAPCCIGLGSAIFHPESSRVARLASGGRFGLAQSVFQVGGNFGQAIGPLLAAFIVVPFGQASVAWFALGALVGMVVLWQVGGWYSAHLRTAHRRKAPAAAVHRLCRRRKVLDRADRAGALTFTKNIYIASLSSYYTFYVIEKFGVSVQDSQLMLFVFLGASAAGTCSADRSATASGEDGHLVLDPRRAAFTLALPYADLFWTNVLAILIGLILSSAFSAIVVLAQELVPGRVGMIAGIFFGFAFGMGGIGAAVLGVVADHKGIDYVFKVCSYLPLLGLLTIFLPNMKTDRVECRALFDKLTMRLLLYRRSPFASQPSARASAAGNQSSVSCRPEAQAFGAV